MEELIALVIIGRLLFFQLKDDLLFCFSHLFLGCLDFDGTIHTEGETWNPYYPGYGKVPCFNCTCNVSIVFVTTGIHARMFVKRYFWRQA